MKERRPTRRLQSDGWLCHPPLRRTSLAVSCVMEVLAHSIRGVGQVTRKVEGYQAMNDSGSLLSKKVFVIHGHDEENLERLKAVLQQRFGLRPVLLREEPDAGMTLIEKFELLAEQSCFAVVLLTPDDHIQMEPGGICEWQPRPNVLFELGWFCGRLGRPGVLFLCKEGTHLPSDFSAVMQKKFHVFVDEPSVVKQMAREFAHKGIIREN